MIGHSFWASKLIRRPLVSTAANLISNFLVLSFYLHFPIVRDSVVHLRQRYKSVYECCPAWSELSRRKLSPTLATALYTSPDNAIGLVAKCELSGYVKLKLGHLLQVVGRKVSHRPGNPAIVGVLRWPSAGDTAGYRRRHPGPDFHRAVVATAAGEKLPIGRRPVRSWSWTHRTEKCVCF